VIGYGTGVAHETAIRVMRPCFIAGRGGGQSGPEPAHRGCPQDGLGQFGAVPGQFGAVRRQFGDRAVRAVRGQSPNSTQSPAPASAPPAQRHRVSRNTNHETRITSESQSPAPQIFFANAHNNLQPHHPKTTQKNLTRHATLQSRPVRIVHPTNSPRLARTVRGCSCGEDSPADTIYSLVPTHE